MGLVFYVLPKGMNTLLGKVKDKESVMLEVKYESTLAIMLVLKAYDEERLATNESMPEQAVNVN